MPDRTHSHARSRTMAELTLDEERWAEALTIERIHGDSAVDWVVERMIDLASSGDEAGVARFMEIIDRLDKVRASGAAH